MQKLLSWLFFICCSINLYGQNRIDGAVQDALTHDPIGNVSVSIVGDSTKTVTNQYGLFRLATPPGAIQLKFEHPRYKTKIVEVFAHDRALIVLEPLPQTAADNELAIAKAKAKARLSRGVNPNYGNVGIGIPVYFNETYGKIYENKFVDASNGNVSNFAIDVDRASYSNIRRFIKLKQDVPPDAVRIEEMVNYFCYDYAPPLDGALFALYTTLSDCPWNPGHLVLQLALKAKQIPSDRLPPSNLVFLIDASGSMSAPNKLPLVQAAARVLVENLRPQDKIAIVTYAGAPSLVLNSTPGNEKEKILQVIDYLSARGATAGEAALHLAYSVAESHFIPGGNNRVIIATDGDFNIGQTSDKDMEDLILMKKESGVYLTCLGFGMHDYKDSKLETLSSKGNGNFAYIDDLEEAYKVFSREFGGTLFTVAKDVKATVAFNDQQVASYRLIGFENKMIKDPVVDSNFIQGGIIGSGHCVVVLYEIVPRQGIDINSMKNWARLNIKYRTPVNEQLQEDNFDITTGYTPWHDSPVDFQFSNAVALFGMWLRGSQYKGDQPYELVQQLAKKALGKDEAGYRKEFVKLVKQGKKCIKQ